MPYSFSIGESTRLKRFDLYGKYALSAWARLSVQEVDGDRVLVKHMNPPSQPCTCCDPFWVEREELQTPLGWQETYDVIVTSYEESDKVKTWFRDRGGVAVFTSLDLSCAGRMMYTPGDKSEHKPHWSMGFVEVVTDPTRIKFYLEISRDDKPTEKEKRTAGWKYDKHRKDWYRRELLK